MLDQAWLDLLALSIKVGNRDLIVIVRLVYLYPDQTNHATLDLSITRYWV